MTSFTLIYRFDWNKLSVFFNWKHEMVISKPWHCIHHIGHYMSHLDEIPKKKGEITWSLILNFFFRPAESDINKFGLNWSAVWVKMGSSWVCVIVYIWVLFCRRCCPCCRDLAFPSDENNQDIEVQVDESENLNPVETITSRESVLWF